MLFKRLRPLRDSEQKRNRHSEITLSAKDFIQPFFISKGSARRELIKNLPENQILSIDELLQDLPILLETGINKILLFPSTTAEDKDNNASKSFSKDNVIVESIRLIKKIYPKLLIFSDVCLCSYTTHGHCGLLKNTTVVNDQTLDILAKIALAHAKAGADYVCPSAMMDGQVLAIRKVLNNHGFHKTKILSYTVKYSSEFYGPFRSATGFEQTHIDRKTYQMDFRNISQTFDEFEADITEGADAFMIKPAHTYLDILCRMRQKFPSLTIAAYHVSGECALLNHGTQAQFIRIHPALKEIFYAFKRSGAHWIVSYYAQTFCSREYPPQ